MSTFDPTQQLNGYLALVPSYNQTPKFLATLMNLLSAFTQGQKLALDMQDYYFDVDNAIGAQLDIVGLWVGVNRTLSAEITNTYFSFDTLNAGFDQGIWYVTGDPTTGTVVLSDDVFRALIKAKIALNSWNGQNRTANGIFNNILAAYSGSSALWLQDNEDRTTTVNVASLSTSALPQVLTALLTNKIFTVKAAGVSQSPQQWSKVLVGASGTVQSDITYPQDGIFEFNTNWSTSYYQSSDEGTYLYTQFSGNFVLSACVLLPNGVSPSQNPQVGLFLRDSMAQNGCTLAAATLGFDLTSKAIIASTADFSTTYPNNPDNQATLGTITQTYVYLRISRSSGTFTLEYSTDGVTYTSTTYTPTSPPQNLNVGLFSTDNSGLTNAFVTGVTLT